MILILGIEDSDVTASCQSFLSARIMFQGDRLPPSNICVRGQSENGFRLANKGKTVFPFAFRIPSDAPSSYYFLKLASLRYVVTGVCMFQYNGKSTDTMFKSTDANVVESWKDSPPPPPLPARAEGEKKTLFFGSAGLVHLDCVLEKSLYTSGSEVYIQVNVKNNSKNRLQGVKIKLNQKLVTFKDSSNTLHIVNDVVSQVSFNTTSFCYDPKEERSSMLHIQIPSTLKSIRNTALAEVLCSVTVSMSLGLFSKDLSVELPIVTLY